MLNAEQNRCLLQEIDANRRFLLLAYRSNPALLAREDERLREQLADVLPEQEVLDMPATRRTAGTDFSG